MSFLFVVTLSPEYCENLCTKPDLVIASGQKHLGPSSEWHPADCSSMCLGYCVVAHLPASSPGHCRIVLSTRAHLLCLCQLSLIFVIGNSRAVAEVSLMRQQDYDQCHSQHSDMFECSVPPVDASN